MLVFGPFELDPDERLLYRDRQLVPLPPKTIQLLTVLVQSGSRLLTKDELMTAVWPDTFVEEHNLTLHVHTLRKTLNAGEGAEAYIETVPRRGYRFVATVREVSRTEAAPQPPLPGRRRLWTQWTALAAVTALLALLPLWRHFNASAGVDAGPPLVRLTTNVAEDTQPAVSPDGRQVLFASNREGGRGDIYVMNADGTNVRNLTPDPAYHDSPAWAPDGRHIAFQSDRRGTIELYVADADGANARVVTAGGRAAWAPDGKRLAYQQIVNGHTEVFTIDLATGRQTQVTSDGVFAGDPSWSPDGRTIAFTATVNGTLQVYVMKPDGSDRTALTSVGRNRLPRWSPDGTRILFTGQRDDGLEGLFVMQADGSLPHRIDADGAQMGQGAWCPDGRSVVFETERDGNNEIYRARLMREPDGAARLTRHVASDDHPVWSPDMRWIAFASNRDGKSAIFVMDANGANVRKLSDGQSRDLDPSWSSDGKWIAFARDSGGGPAISVMDPAGEHVRKVTDGQKDVWPAWSPDGRELCFDRNYVIFVTSAAGGTPRRIADGERCAWSPDGRSIAFDRDTAGSRELYTVPAGGGDPVPLTRNGHNTSGLAWSPDGARIAFGSNHDGRGMAIFVMNADGSGTVRLAGLGSFDQHPAWSADGKWIAFSSERDGNEEIYKVAVTSVSK